MKRLLPASLLAAATLATFLWPALSAPVILWSDSHTDLAWAKEGLGIFKPIPPPAAGKPIDHLPKPGYLLFLRLAMSAFPSLGEARSVVVVQSALLALSLLGTALFLARRRGIVTGAGVLLVCLVFLRLRDASSAVMTEALAAALLLPIAAAILEPARWRAAGALMGFACGTLFLVRPNCGGIVLVIAVIVFTAARETRRLVLLLGGFVLVILPFWFMGRSNLPGDPLHGLGYQIVEGSAEYYWAPSIAPWPVGETPGEAAAEELRVARENWKKTLSTSGPDMRREIAWRAFHGLMGIEFYDSRWSAEYETADIASRLASPFLILVAAAVLLAAPWRDGRAKLAGLTLLAVCVAQDLLLGSNPRYALPLLPVLFLLAASSLPRLAASTWAHRLGAVLCLAGLILAAAWQRHILDWQWGKIESAGVTIHQAIPRGALPARGPATLHLRIAPALAPSPAQLDVFGPGQRLLYSSGRDGARQRPLLTISLPASVLEANQADRIFLELRSSGSYGETSYLLFPVIPQPWARLALRDGSESLSPSTGILRGALDWWAHPGVD